MLLVLPPPRRSGLSPLWDLQPFGKFFFLPFFDKSLFFLGWSVFFSFFIYPSGVSPLAALPHVAIRFVYFFFSGVDSFPFFGEQLSFPSFSCDELLVPLGPPAPSPSQFDVSVQNYILMIKRI